MVPILLETNPYSFEKRKYGGISGSGHAACTLSIRTRIRSESNFFRGMEYPDTSLKRRESRPVNVLIFLDMPSITTLRQQLKRGEF